MEQKGVTNLMKTSDEFVKAEKIAGQMKKCKVKRKTGRTIETENGCSSNDKTRILPVIKKLSEKPIFPATCTLWPYFH